jgi:hypothetical protein
VGSHAPFSDHRNELSQRPPSIAAVWFFDARTRTRAEQALARGAGRLVAAGMRDRPEGRRHPYRFVWRGPDETDTGLRGVSGEIVLPELLVYTELFHETWYSGSVCRGRPTRLSSNPHRGRGIAESYDRLAELLAPQRARGSAA